MARPKRLVSFLRERVGDGVRAVGVYDGDAVDLLYARDDVGAERARATLQEIHRNLRNGRPEEPRLAQSLGDVTATLQLREGGVVLHLVGGDEGALVELEGFVAKDLSVFVEQCARETFEAA